MINCLCSSMQMPHMQSNQAPMTDEQKESIQEILSQYSADNLSDSDASSIVASFAELDIAPNQELAELMAGYGFDASSIGDAARTDGAQIPPPPPPSNSVSNSSEMVSFLEELLENYDEQLSEDDKDAILAAVQEKFSLDNEDSLIKVTT